MKPGFNPSAEEPPLRFEIRVDEDPTRSPAGFCPYCGVLDPRVDHVTVMTVEFRSGCGADDVCRSDLALDCSSAGSVPFVVGSSDFVTLVFTVTNLLGGGGPGLGSVSDPAFKPQLRIPVPPGVGIRKTAKECTEAVSVAARQTF